MKKRLSGFLKIAAAAAFVFAAPVLVVSDAFAQRAGGAEEAKPEHMNVRVSLVSLDSDINELRYMRNGRFLEKVLIPSGFKPRPIRYTGPVPFALYTEKKTVDPRTKRETVEPVKALDIPIPARSGDYFVLLKRYGTGATARYAPMVIADEFTKDSMNRWRLISFAPGPVAVVFTPDLTRKPVKTVIHPGKSVVLTFGAKETYVSGQVYQLATVKGRQDWQLANSTRYLYTPGSAKTFIYYPDPGAPTHLNLKGLLSQPLRDEGTETNRPGTGIRPRGR